MSRPPAADTLLTALAPVAACVVALGALTAWVDTGGAGSPPRIEVTPGRVFLPFGDTEDTAAFFDITNSGGAEDRLVAVASDEDGRQPTLSRHRMTEGGAAYRAAVGSASVPAGGDLSMTPLGVDVTLRAGPGWHVGDVVPFTLYFEHSGRVETSAVVVVPGGT
ncbi:copper chaperone PCu(A)C [Streptomyces sp. NPDC089424]|uniref:copper chaperone PCu(A)C n=1 Tax=Streptomyces sp. NPDC089424 TaxID=3365917 RepID=UPI00382CE761